MKSDCKILRDLRVLRDRRKLKHVIVTDGLAEQGSRSGRGSIQAAADQEETLEKQEEKPGDG